MTILISLIIMDMIIKVEQTNDGGEMAIMINKEHIHHQSEQIIVVTGKAVVNVTTADTPTIPPPPADTSKTHPLTTETSQRTAGISYTMCNVQCNSHYYTFVFH